MKKLIINLKAAYKAQTPRIAKIIGNIGITLLAIALAITTAYPMLPYQFTTTFPPRIAQIIGALSFLITALSKFAFMKQSYQEAQALLISTANARQATTQAPTPTPAASTPSATDAQNQTPQGGAK